MSRFLFHMIWLSYALPITLGIVFQPWFPRPPVIASGSGTRRLIGRQTASCRLAMGPGNRRTRVQFYWKNALATKVPLVEFFVCKNCLKLPKTTLYISPLQSNSPFVFATYVWDPVFKSWYATVVIENTLPVGTSGNPGQIGSGVGYATWFIGDCCDILWPIIEMQ